MEHIPKDSGHEPDDPPTLFQQHNNTSTDISLDNLPDDGTMHRNTFTKGKGGDSGSEEIGVSYPFTKASDAPLDTDDDSWFCDDGVAADEHSDYDPKCLDLDLDLDDQQNQRMSGSTHIALKNENNDQHRVLLKPMMVEYPQSPCSDRTGSSPIAEPIGESFVADSPRSSFRWTESLYDEHEEIEEESEEDDDSLMIGCPNIFSQLAIETGDFVVRHRNKPWFQVGVAVSLCAISLQMGAFTQNTLSIGDTAHSRGPTDGRQVEVASVSHSGNVHHRSVAASTAAVVHQHFGDRLLMADSVNNLIIKQDTKVLSVQTRDSKRDMPILTEESYNELMKLHGAMTRDQRYSVSFVNRPDYVKLRLNDKDGHFETTNTPTAMSDTLNAYLDNKRITWSSFTWYQMQKKWRKGNEVVHNPNTETLKKRKKDGWLIRQKWRGFIAKRPDEERELYRIFIREYYPGTTGAANMSGLKSGTYGGGGEDIHGETQLLIRITEPAGNVFFAVRTFNLDLSNAAIDDMQRIEQGQVEFNGSKLPILSTAASKSLKAIHAQIQSGHLYQVVFQDDTVFVPIKYENKFWVNDENRKDDRSDLDLQTMLKTETIWTAFTDIRLEKKRSIAPNQYKIVKTEQKAAKYMKEGWKVSQKRRGFIATGLDGKVKYSIVIQEYGRGMDDQDPPIPNSARIKYGAYPTGIQDKPGETQLLLELPKKDSGDMPPLGHNKDVWIIQEFNLEVVEVTKLTKAARALPPTDGHATFNQEPDSQKIKVNDLFKSNAAENAVPIIMPILPDDAYDFLMALHGAMTEGSSYRLEFTDPEFYKLELTKKRWTAMAQSNEEIEKSIGKRIPLDTAMIWSSFTEIKMKKKKENIKWYSRSKTNNPTVESFKIAKELNGELEIHEIRRGFIAKDESLNEKFRIIIREYGPGTGAGSDGNSARLIPGIFFKENGATEYQHGESQLLLEMSANWYGKMVYVLSKFNLEVTKVDKRSPDIFASASASGSRAPIVPPHITNMDAPPPIDSGDSDTTRTPSTTEEGDDSSNDNTDDDWWHRESSIKGFNNGLVLMLFLSFLVVHLSVFSTLIAVITTANA